MSDEGRGFPAEARCACGTVQFTVTHKPMFVHCCHCTWCQRESGSAFALNALVETDRLAITQGSTTRETIPTASGRGQTVIRCAACHSPLWSHFGGVGERVAFVRVGALSDPGLCPPDIHIYTSTKRAWVKLDPGVPAMEEFYRRSEQWPAESVTRYKTALQA